jgi:NTP-dependent ternary system trypsin peptidase co-occuring protein
MADVEGRIPLAKWIGALRAELEHAQQEGGGQQLQFTVGPLELEFEMAVTHEAGGRAGIRFWVLDLGASGKRGGETTQRVKMTLEPKTTGGQPVSVQDRLPEVPD